jgi:hypothetical protein
VWGPRRFQPPRLPDVAGPQSPSVADPASSQAGHVPTMSGTCLTKAQGTFADEPERHGRTQEKAKGSSHSLPSSRFGDFCPQGIFDQAQATPLNRTQYPPGRGHRPGHGGWPPIQGRVGIEVETMMNTARISSTGI